MAEIELATLALLFAAAFAAGFVDAIAGGGGLITVPALLLTGMPPLQAIATNKLQGLFGAGTAAWRYAAAGQVDLRSQLPGALIALVASAVGALAIASVPQDFLGSVLPFLLITIAIYFAAQPKLGDTDRRERLTPRTIMMTFVPLIAFYDGFFGPGTGSFFMLVFIAFAGFGVLKATAHTKLLNFASNVGGFAVFAFAGAIVWKIGIVMAVGQVLGATVGSSLAIRKGARLIKPLLVVTCLALALRLLMSN
ncbi:MAG: TSUP family transporter [Pseudomonadota bacterium]